MRFFRMGSSTVYRVSVHICFGGCPMFGCGTFSDSSRRSRKTGSCQRFLSKRFRSKQIERHGTNLSERLARGSFLPGKFA